MRRLVVAAGLCFVCTVAFGQLTNRVRYTLLDGSVLIDDCLRLMRMSGVRSVPVVRGLTPVGILSFTDVLRAVSS